MYTFYGAEGRFRDRRLVAVKTPEEVFAWLSAIAKLSGDFYILDDHNRVVPVHALNGSDELNEGKSTRQKL